jgi:hypothetical protein
MAILQSTEIGPARNTIAEECVSKIIPVTTAGALTPITRSALATFALGHCCSAYVPATTNLAVIRLRLVTLPR